MNVEDDRDDGFNSDDGSTSDDDSDSQDSDFLVDPDNMIDDVDVDMAEFRSNIDANVRWVGSNAIVTMKEEEFEKEGVNHDELDNGSDSEYEGERKKALKMYHKMKKANASNAESGGTTWKENFYVGLKFSNSKEIKEMVPQFGCEDEDDDSGSKGVVLSGSKGKGQSKEKGQMSGSKGKSNNKTKAGGGIKDKGEYCRWSLQCSKLPNEETWAVKTFKDTHKCLQSRIVKKCTASFLSKSVEESIKPNPKIPLNALKDQLQKQYEVGISKQKNINPNTTIKIEVEPPENINSTERKFKRVYVCLDPLKDGFKADKRDLLGLDGCFLSGSYAGLILTAVGVDLNNEIYPLAYAIVEYENKDSWKWFFECVGDDLDLFRNSNFTFISDRQKGIIPSIGESFPSAEYRFCLKHIYDNMKLSWKGRAHCDVLLNNMCEVFNRQLVDERDKPIITCLEFIREYMMKRIVNVQKVISKSDGPLTPNATKVFNIIVKEAGQMKTQQSSQAPPTTQATQASQTGHTTPFHPSQLHALPTKMTKASAARRSST
nr:hypothetical protein [Tanacetum cinerariifolium]